MYMIERLPTATSRWFCFETSFQIAVDGDEMAILQHSFPPETVQAICIKCDVDIRCRCFQNLLLRKSSVWSDLQQAEKLWV